MFKKKFYTVIKKDHKLGGNKYVEGVIWGILSTLCVKDDIPYGHGDIKIGHIFIVKCRCGQYKKACKMIEERYKDLCIFDYKVES